MPVKTIEIDPRDLPQCLSSVAMNATVAPVVAVIATTAEPTRRALMGGMLAAFATAPGAMTPAIPTSLKAACLTFGERTEFHVLPPGRQAPVLPDGAWRSRLALGGGWELLVVNLVDAA